MDGQHGLLDQIFGLRCASANAGEFALVIGTQTTAQPIEQRAMRCRIAVQRSKHQGLEFDFVGGHACVSFSSLERPVYGGPARYSAASGRRKPPDDRVSLLTNSAGRPPSGSRDSRNPL